MASEAAADRTTRFWTPKLQAIGREQRRKLPANELTPEWQWKTERTLDGNTPQPLGRKCPCASLVGLAQVHCGGGGLADLLLLLRHLRWDTGEEWRREVALRRVGNHGQDHGALGSLLAHVKCCGNGRAPGDAAEDPLLLRKVQRGLHSPVAPHEFDLPM